MAQLQLGPDGYKVVLPQGWVRLNVRESIDSVLTQALSGVDFGTLPRDDRPRRRAAIEGRLRRAVDAAKSIDAYAMYVPLGGMHGIAVPASFVVAEATDFSGVGSTQDVLRELLRSPGAQPMLVDGSDAVRTDSASSAVDDLSGVQVSARQIVYTIAVPDSSRWLVVVFDVISGDDDGEDYRAFVEALVALFDGVMTTFRWTFVDDQQ